MNISNTKLVGSIFVGTLLSITPSYAMDIELFKKGAQDSFLSLKEKILAPLNRGVNARDINFNTPLIRAIQENDDERVDDLLNHPEINVNAPNEKGKTPLLIASKTRIHPCIVHGLLNHPNIDVNSADINGITPLHRITCHSAKAGSDLIVQHLLKKGANINSQTKRGLTPLMCAFGSQTQHCLNTTEVIDEILQHPQLDVTIKDEDGQTAESFVYAMTPCIEQIHSNLHFGFSPDFFIAGRETIKKRIQQKNPRYIKANILLGAQKDNYGPTLTGIPWGLRKKIAEYVNEGKLTETQQEQFEKLHARDAIMEKNNFSPDQKRSLEKHLKLGITSYEREALDAYIVQKSIEIAHAVEQNRTMLAPPTTETLRGAPGKEELN